MTDRRGTLYLIPTVIAEGTQDAVIPPLTLQHLKRLEHFAVENVRSARRYFSSLNIFPSIETLSFSVLDKDTPEGALHELLAPLLNGNDMGVVSESGCPGVADPGMLAVRYAHRHQIRVVPLVGPSSILLAVMASGLSGQSFAFHGYLPIDPREAGTALRDLERFSGRYAQTQVVMETPYRNNRMLGHLLKYLADSTDLCVALDLTGEQEKIATRAVRDWKKNPVELPKLPALFLFAARSGAPDNPGN